MEKIAWDGPKWGQEDFFPANPDLADILGRTDFDFDNFCFFGFVGSQIPRFPGSQISKFPDRGLGQAWADLDLLDHSSAVAPRWLRGTPGPQSW